VFATSEQPRLYGGLYKTPLSLILNKTTMSKLREQKDKIIQNKFWVKESKRDKNVIRLLAVEGQVTSDSSDDENDLDNGVEFRTLLIFKQ